MTGLPLARSLDESELRLEIERYEKTVKYEKMRRDALVEEVKSSGNMIDLLDEHVEFLKKELESR